MTPEGSLRADLLSVRQLPPAQPSVPAQAAAWPIYDVSKLFEQGNEVRIRFRDAEYRLRLTRNFKLILMK